MALAAFEIEMRMFDFMLNGALEIVGTPVSAQNFEAGEPGLIIS